MQKEVELDADKKFMNITKLKAVKDAKTEKYVEIIK